MRVFCYSLRPYDELGFMQECADEYGFDFGWTSEGPTPENAHLAEGYDSLSVITTPLDAALLDRFWELGIRGLATRSIGFDHIDIARCRELGLPVGNAAYPPDGVADFTVMLILMALRKAKLVLELSRAQDFSLRGKLGRSLSQLTVGVVGTGNIGRAVIDRLRGFGCRVLAYDPYPRDDVADKATYLPLDELLSQSDVITLHAPGLPENRHMIGARELALLPRGAVVVNAARGLLVDTDALVDALESGQVGAAALDTIENEADLYYLDRSRDILPNRDRALLEALPNVVVFPHVAFYTEEDVRGMVRSNVTSLMAFAKGETSPYQV